MNESRERLIDGVFVSDADDATGRLHTAFNLVLDSAAAEQAIRNALKETVTMDNYEDLVRRAVESGVITEEQASMVRLAQKATAVVIAVDDFPRSVIEDNENTMLRSAGASATKQPAEVEQSETQGSDAAEAEAEEPETD
jgi:acyl-CoA dehydrogenase